MNADENISIKEHNKKGLSPNDDSGKSWLIIFDVIILLVIVICGLIAIWTYTSHNEYTHNYTQSISPDNKVLKGFISLNFTSEVFSAQSPIHVSAIFYFSPQFRSSHPYLQNVTTVYVWLTHSVLETTAQYYNGVRERYPMNLTENNDGSYRGSALIHYDEEGDKCLIFDELNNVAVMGCVPTPSNIMIHISSVDSLLQLNANKITLTLTWVLVAFTIVAIRSFLKDMFQNLSDYIKKER
jgi:hypothetical protein